MDQLRQLYHSLTLKQKISIAMACALLGAGIFALSKYQAERGFEALFRELSGEDAAAVVAKLKEKGVDYRLAQNGGTVLVQSDRVSEMRLEMAGAGLVKSGRPGFELFDKVNFGVTDFAEQVNFRRALEGELERSVMSLAEVEKARVHLTFKKDSVYLESRQQAKASILVRLRPGAKLSAQNVQAVTHLVASAVDGLAPESVTVLDMNGNLLGKPRRARADGTEELNDASLEYQQAIEKQLLLKINNTLEPLLGPERFRAAVSVDCDMGTVDESEEVFDPNRSVMSTLQKSEDYASTGSAGGVPGTASALPRSPTDNAKGTVGNSRKTESTTFQTTRTVRHRKVPQGALKRISVSVLLDNEVEWQGQGAERKRVFVMPPPERVKSIRDLVAGVVGFTQDRGDQIVVETLPFDLTMHSDPPPEKESAPVKPLKAPTLRDNWVKLVRDPNRLMPVSAVLLVVFVLGVGLWQFRRARTKRKLKQKATLEAQKALAAAAEREALEEKARPALAAADTTTTVRLAELVMEKPEQCALVLKQWLAEQEV
jgi:flagellar M-ring protein FliF